MSSSYLVGVLVFVHLHFLWFPGMQYSGWKIHRQFSMGTLQFQRFHTSLLPLLVLLRFSSLQFLSVAYTVPNKYFISCGSASNVTDTDSNRVFVGESFLSFSFPKQSSTAKATNQSSAASPIYQTARIFQSQFSYRFSIDNHGYYVVRLHFFAFSSSSSNLSTARFNVSVPKFWLLQNFGAQNSGNSPLVKEYFLDINSNSLSITFTPLESSFAFVNAIELFPLPANFIVDVAPYVTSEGSTRDYEGMLSRLLQTSIRLNVGDSNVSRDQDGLWREWGLDDPYLNNTKTAKNFNYNGSVKYLVGDDSAGPNASKYIAPQIVYKTAKEVDNSSASNASVTWVLPVEKNVPHLVRVHFCDFDSSTLGLTYFYLFIYNKFSEVINSYNVSDQLPAPFYYDFVVESDDSGVIRLSIAPIASAAVPNAFLNGLEVMRIIDSSNSVPAEETNEKKNHLAVVLGPTLGGVFLICVMVGGIIFCRLKFKKLKPVENSDWTPLPAGGSSHSRLTEGTIQGSPLPNLNLGLKISLLEIQFATNSFDKKWIIGKGGFGNVYKGVLKNGLRVAVKRGEPGSGQGLPEFQTEIMVLSKIRHRHLVSLIGYCDERSEMILVYEYMEKGTLRDHLYNSNLPSLSWKQRLEICIGAARGLHYLHKGAAGGIIHRDVKSTNILLDENHVAKVADFGLSRTGPLDHQPYVSTGVKGTFGYLDPEYFRSQQLTEKSDVYSFGVVLLEVLCARPAIEPNLPREQVNLAEWGILCKNKGTLEEIIDPSIKGQINPNSIRKFSETIEKCLQEDGWDRPTMGDVLWDLEYALQLQRGAIQREPHEDSSSGASASLQLPNVRRLPSLSTLSEVSDTLIVRGDESDSAVDAVFSQLNIDHAR